MAVGIPGATPFGGHAGPVYCVAFSPDGTAFATGGGDGVVRLWDTGTRTQTRQLIGHVDAVHTVAWSPDGTYLASGGTDHVVRLWDAAAGQQTSQLTGHSHRVRSVAWSPDGTTVASGAYTVRLWDARSGQQNRKFTEHGHPVNAVAWRPDGSTIASAAGTVRLWDAGTGRQLTQLAGHSGQVDSLTWHPDGSFLATGAGNVRIWDTRGISAETKVTDAAYRITRTPLRQINDVSGELWAVAWSPDGTALAVSSGSGIQLWDAATDGQTRQLDSRAAAIRAVAWHPDGSIIVGVDGDDGTLHLWDTTAGAQLTQLTGHTGSVYAVGWSPDGTTIATAGEDRAARLWDTATGAQTDQLNGHANWARAVAWSPDGTSIATASDDGTARLWDAATGAQTSQLTGHSGPVWTVGWSPNGTFLATAGIDGTAWLWDAATGTQTNQLTGHGDAIYTVAWSPDGTTIATASDDSTTRLWDAATGAQLTQLTGHTGSVNDVAWHPDGTVVATASDDGTARLWDPATGAQTNQLIGYTGWVWGVAWSPDGTAIATAGSDGTARVWDPATGAQTTQLTGHTGPVNRVTWSPDGTTIATVGQDGTIRIWNPRNGAQINGTGFGVARAAARPLAGVRSDSPSVVDLLGVGDDVGTLAELIAATETKPPLAIALVGNWGAGKSSVMLQVESRVTDLATKAKNNPGLSAFAENVRQVRFNAWHYSDDRLWAGLVSHLFEGLAGPGNPAAGPDEPASRSARADIARVRSELASKEDRLTVTRAEADSLTAELKDAAETARPKGVLESLGSPVYAGKVLLDAVRQALHDVRGGLLAALIWAVLGGVAYLAWRFLGAWAGSVSSAVAVLAAPAVAVLRKLRAAHAEVLAFVNQRHSDLLASQKRAQQDLRDAEREIRELQDRLVLVDAAEGLARFLDERAQGTTYREYRGLLGQVRADLDQLSASLEKARLQWVRGGRFGPPPLERIVLYIDDLDRCPPKRVVEVLEAVHLMLALELFVVVVAVDARWLIRSLEYHHRELFGAGTGLATPIDYLDKIFQIPFVLLPPQPEATALYLRSLLPEPARAAASGTPGRGEGDAAGSAGVADTPSETRAAAEAEESPGQTSRLNARGEARGVDEAGGFRRGDRAPLDTRKRGTGDRSRAGVGELAAQPVAVELRPQGLQLTQPEVEFMGRLGGLLPTPRAAKRLVNIYRLVRIGVPAQDLAGFVGDEAGGPYQAVQVLLALLVGHPLFARDVFREVIAGHHGPDLAGVVAEVGGRGAGTRPFGMIHAFLIETREEAPLSVSMELGRRWCPQLARFSFYTRELAGGDLDVAAGTGLADVDLGRDALAEFGDVADDADEAAAGAEAV